ncbi:hypothetical protein HPB49_020114 [Dermacentor silvarum]|uniref:Uncharacterized protein n=1 Tax=Dermacentor silvarum TaxID=543639 RepID=A0ACB8CH69_DERSI|nr:hypothetical protein HPB49_020114 [Dermacentor silvarum]
MTSERFQEWVARVLGPNSDDVRRLLLILDHAPIHETPAAKDALEECDTDVYVPASCTSLLQPAMFTGTTNSRLDFAVRGKPASGRATGHEKATSGSHPSPQDVLRFVSEAWAAISEETIARSFNVCSISNALDGLEDGQKITGTSRPICAVPGTIVVLLLRMVAFSPLILSTSSVPPMVALGVASGSSATIVTWLSSDYGLVLRRESR